MKENTITLHLHFHILPSRFEANAVQSHLCHARFFVRLFCAQKFWQFNFRVTSNCLIADTLCYYSFFHSEIHKWEFAEEFIILVLVF